MDPGTNGITRLRFSSGFHQWFARIFEAKGFIPCLYDIELSASYEETVENLALSMMRKISTDIYISHEKADHDTIVGKNTFRCMGSIMCDNIIDYNVKYCCLRGKGLVPSNIYLLA